MSDPQGTDDVLKEGPGAAVAEPKEVQIIELDGHVGHTLEPEWKRLPIGPDNILYPVIVGIALFPLLITWPTTCPTRTRTRFSRTISGLIQ